MSTFGITARFPLGVYYGHTRSGLVDDFPDPARLHAALTHAASVGSVAVEKSGRLTASEDSIEALRWLESHPPDGIELPKMMRPSHRVTEVYRAEGTVVNEGGVHKLKVYTRPVADGVAVHGRVGWSWNGDVPAQVQRTLAHLCQDVSCLGEATSPVILEVGEVHPNLLRDKRISRFSAGGTRVRVADQGRFDALEAAYRSQYSKAPTESADRWSASRSSDSPRAALFTDAGVHEMRYEAPRRVVTRLPWSHVMEIKITGVSAESDPATMFSADKRVSWAVALHRALVARIGLAAPPLITGRYARDSVQPANRLAIQYLDSQMASLSAMGGGHGYGVFAIMVPVDAGNDDLLVFENALSGLRSLRSRYGRLDLEVNVDRYLCERFWSPPAAGMRRSWITVPATVAETRRVSNTWTLRDATRLSIGNVFRDHLEVSGSGGRYSVLADAVKKGGVVVGATHRLHVDGSRYVHRMNKDVVAQPYVAEIEFGQSRDGTVLVSDTSVIAIGQSRHLGGGLLVPRDSLSVMDEQENRQ